MDDPIVSPYYLYVLEVPSGAVKIGITQDVKKRIQQIQTANHEVIRVAFWIKMSSADTAQSLEWILHKRYKHNAIHREWFRMPASDVLKDIGFALDLLKLIAPGVNLGNIVIPSQHPVKPSPAPQNVPPPPSGFVLKKPTNQRNEDTDDEIYEAACIVIRRQKKASISLLQRRFRIGYVRAARIMARIEDSGLLSELFLVEQGDGGFR